MSIYMDWGPNPAAEAAARSLLAERADEIREIAFRATSTKRAGKDGDTFTYDDVEYHRISELLRQMIAETALKAFDVGLNSSHKEHEGEDDE